MERPVPEATPRRYALGVAFQAVARGVHGGVSFLVLVVLAAVLPPEGVGIYASYLALFGLLDVLADAGTGLALVRRASAAPETLGALLPAARRLRLLAALAAAAAAVLYQALDPRVAAANPWGWLCALALLSHVPGIHGAAFHLRLDFAPPSAARGASAVLSLAATGALALSGAADPLAYLLASVGRTAVTNGILWWRARPLLQARPGPPQGSAAGFVRESLELGLGGVLREGYARADLLLLRWIVGPAAAGLYAPARAALGFALQWPSYVLAVALPPLAARAGADWPDFRRRAFRLARNLAAGAVPAAALSLPLAPCFLRSFLGADYAAAAPALRWLAAAAALAYPGSVLLTAFVAAGAARAALLLSAAALALNLSANALLIPRFSLAGAAAARAAAEALALAWPAYLLWRRREAP